MELVKTKEIAKHLGISTDTVYTLVKNKQIPNIKLGGQTRFTKETIDQWLEEQEKYSVQQ